MIRKSFSTPWSNLFHFFVCLVPVSMSGIQGGACDDNAPCLGRGGCYFIEDRVSQTLFSTKCVCVKGYSGRWCQFPGIFFFFFLLIVTSKNRICICFENFHSKLIHCICIFFNSGRQINVAYRNNKSERYVSINEMNKICTLKILKTLIGCSILYQPSDWLTFSPPKRYVVRRYTTLKDVTLHWKTLHYIERRYVVEFLNSWKNLSHSFPLQLSSINDMYWHIHRHYN